MRIPWLQKAFKCCGGPILFLCGIYFLLGGLFLVGSVYLDPKMGSVGEILLSVGLIIFLLFLILAYRSYKLEQKSAHAD